LKAADVLIAWTPAPCARVHLPPELQSTAGEVAVLPWPAASGLARAYARTLGGADPIWRALPEEAWASRLSTAFNTLVVRDGIDPAVAHANLLRIDEYRREVCKSQPTGPRCAPGALIDAYNRAKLDH
jgi:hypothetical protein